MSGILQSLIGGTYPLPPPTTIGQAYGGGYYGGQLVENGVTYYLVVSPKASGSNGGAGSIWGPNDGGATYAYSKFDGLANSNTLNSATYPPAYYCRGLNIGGYTDWYLPAPYEINTLYWYFKPGTGSNNTSSGSNPNAVSPQPVDTFYTLSSPGQTSITDFRTGGTETFGLNNYWTSSEREGVPSAAYAQNFDTGLNYDANVGASQAANDKGSNQLKTRAIRKVRA